MEMKLLHWVDNVADLEVVALYNMFPPFIQNFKAHYYVLDHMCY